MSQNHPAHVHPPVPAKGISAGVLISDWERRVLLVQPARQPTWEIPGGMVEVEEAPRVAARRTVHEELGIEVTVGQLLVIDWEPPGEDGGDTLQLIYDGGTLDDADAQRIRLRAGELNAYGFVEIETAVGLLSANAERRVKLAVRARRLGRSLELEDGRLQIARELAYDE